MARPLSNVVKNLSEELHKIKGKFEKGNKKCKTCRIKHKCCNCFLEYKNFKDHLIEMLWQKLSMKVG